MRNLLLLLTIQFILFSCKTEKKEKVDIGESYETKEQLDNIVSDESIEFVEKSRKIENYIVNLESIPIEEEIKRINIKCALFKNPDTLEVKKMKEEYGEDFFVVADDNIWYSSESKNFLDSLDIELFYVSEERFIQFVDNENNSIYVDLKGKFSLPWNLIFFDPAKGLKIAEMTSISEEYDSFFK